MRILHPHPGNLYGGTERVLAAIARNGERAAGLRSSFALAFDGACAAELRGIGSPVAIVGGVRLSRPSTVMRARAALGELLAAERPDLMLCHSPWSLAVFGPVAKAHEVPLAFWLHDALDAWHWIHAFARRARPRIAICNSRFTQGTLRTLFDDLPSEVIHPPLDAMPASIEPTTRADVRAELGTPLDAVVVVQASRLEEWKGHRDHLRALAAIPEPSWVSWIVGGAQRPVEARYLATLREDAESLGIASRVRFVGPRSDVPRIMGAADIYCQPNLGPEPFGLTFVEAMSAGIPVVTSAAGGALEIVTPATGILVPRGRPASLETALHRLIADDELRSRLGENGPAHARALCDLLAAMRRLRRALEGAAVGDYRAPDPLVVVS